MFGFIAIVVFLILAYVIGTAATKFEKAKVTKAWLPLQPIINGVIENNGSAVYLLAKEASNAASWLLGTYNGKKILASIYPNKRKFYFSRWDRYNYFSAAILELEGKKDWKVIFNQSTGKGASGFSIIADKELEQSLRNAGILDLVTSVNNAGVAYYAGSRLLQLSDSVIQSWTPTPEKFKKELELLLKAAAINEQVNVS
jgi:hypothetical protein